MMSAFITASMLICLTPGPSILVVMKHSIEGGIKKGLMAILGVVIADAFLLTLSMSGLGILLQSSGSVYATIKYLGAFYLIYLGGKTLMGKKSGQNQPNSRSPAFINAVSTTLLNPKIIGFFIAFFPQFIDPSASLGAQLSLLGPLFLLIVFCVLLAYALFADLVKEKLKSGFWNSFFITLTALSFLFCGLLSLK